MAGRGMVTVGPIQKATPRGNLGALDDSPTDLVRSSRYPLDLILNSHKFARAIGGAGEPALGGCQAPMRLECLRPLLRESQSVIILLARGVDDLGILGQWHAGLDSSSLLFLLPLLATVRRPTIEVAAQCNSLVAELALHINREAVNTGPCERLAR